MALAACSVIWIWAPKTSFRDQAGRGQVLASVHANCDQIRQANGIWQCVEMQ
jgi:hypothetical protein